MPKRHHLKSSPRRVEDNEVFERVEDLDDMETRKLENMRETKWDLEDHVKFRSLCLLEYLTYEDIEEFLEYVTTNYY
jgi:hypothetical protein